MAARHAVCCFKHSSSALRFSYLSHESYFRVNPWPPVTSIRREELSRTLKISKGKYTRVPFIKRPGAAAEYSDTDCFEFYKHAVDVKYTAQFSHERCETLVEHLVS